MPGKFRFSLANTEKFNQAAYLEAIHETRKLKQPPDVYVAYGPEDMGVAMVVKAQQRQEWTLVLPTDPNKYALECGFTYGITSRRAIWDFVRPVLLGVCRSSPQAFELMWEDDDLGDVVEVGRFDPAVGKRGDIVVVHRGLPSAEQMEKLATPHQHPLNTARPGGGGAAGGGVSGSSGSAGGGYGVGMAVRQPQQGFPAQQAQQGRGAYAHGQQQGPHHGQGR